MLANESDSVSEADRYWQGNGISVHISNYFRHNIRVNSTQKDVALFLGLVGKPGKLVINYKWFL